MTDSPHDNDADSRPRIYKQATSKHGQVEVTVEGAEGETVNDIADEATEQFADALDGQTELRQNDEQPEKRGCQ